MAESTEPSTVTIKCVAVGDGFTGKTCLLSRLADKEYEPTYEPTVFDNSCTELIYNGINYRIHLLDTAGQEEFELIRSVQYTNTNVFLVCFSITNFDSFSNINEVWLPEVRKYSKNASIILVGTKSDLRNDPETIDRMNFTHEIFVTDHVANSCALKNGLRYIECSAKTKEKIADVKSAIVQCYLTKKVETQKSKYSTSYCMGTVMRFLKRAFCCERICHC